MGRLMGGQPRQQLPGLIGLAPPMIVRQPGSTVPGQIEEWLSDAIAAGLAGFSEQLRRHGKLAGARVLSATAHRAGVR